LPPGERQAIFAKAPASASPKRGNAGETSPYALFRPASAGKVPKNNGRFHQSWYESAFRSFLRCKPKAMLQLGDTPASAGITNPDIRTAPKRGNPSRLSGILAERIKKNMISIKNQSFPAFNSAAGRTHILQK
jgi:hypothetical protein